MGDGTLATMLFPTAGWLGFPVPAALSSGSGWGRLLFTVIFLIVIFHVLVLLLRTCRPSGPLETFNDKKSTDFNTHHGHNCTVPEAIPLVGMVAVV